MKWWKIMNQSNQAAELLLYGYIGDGWIGQSSLKEFTDALQDLKQQSNITVRINSSGGEVLAAQAIYNLLKSHPAYITVIIDGLVASAASLIAMAADKIIMPNNALMMIHNPVIYMSGDQSTLIHAADVLAKTKETMLHVYAKKTGKDHKSLSEMMDAETWLGAEEALAAGFIDEIDNSYSVNLMSNQNKLIINGLSVDLKSFKNVPVAITTTSNIPNSTRKEDMTMTLEQLQKEYPELYKNIYNAGAIAERERIKAIDSINAIGYEAMKSKAKYESIQQVGEVAIAIINAQAARIQQTNANIQSDIQASHVNDITVDDAPLPQGNHDMTTKSLIQKAIAAANANIKGGQAHA